MSDEPKHSSELLKEGTQEVEDATVVASVELDEKTIIHSVPLLATQQEGMPASLEPTVLHEHPSAQTLASEEPTSSLTIGQTLKGRFVIESLIGIGGMGIVYKALDLRKKEAQDKHPYIAIKVLREDFKRHPESFIALQRESRKAQHLAHPNIVNVYDFDRDGETVYMTMELLEGKSLDELLAYDYPNGLPKAEAENVIRGAAQALAYAHANNIVHADFKPSNIFVCTDGRVKVFDFGIARAVNAKHEPLDEKTVFDAHTLGALTPTYASYEMLEGGEPLPQDDCYAMGCVAYITLTGKHPFRRKPANQASLEKLTLQKINSISKVQWKVVQACCAFERHYRLKEVKDVALAFTPSEKSRAWLVVFAVSCTVLLAVSVYFAYEFFQIKTAKEMIFLSIQKKDERALSVALERLDDFSHTTKTTVLEDAKTDILKFYSQKVEVSLANGEGTHEAHLLYALAKGLYPDSLQLLEIEKIISSHEFELLNALSTRYEIALAENALLNSDKQNIIEILTQVKEIKTNYYLLSDPDLADAYFDAAQSAFTLHKKESAQTYIDQGLVFFPDDARLIDLKDAILISELRPQTRITSPDIFTSAQVMLKEYDNLLEAPFDQKDWFEQMLRMFEVLKQKIPAHKSAYQTRKDSFLKVLFSHAQTLRELNRFSLAKQYLNTIEKISPNYVGLVDEYSLLVANESIFSVNLKRQRQSQEQDKLKQKFELAMGAKDIVRALNMYQSLVAVVPDRDTYLHDTARYQLETLLFTVVDKLEKEGAYNEAVLLLEQAEVLLPNNDTLKDRLNLLKKQKNQGLYELAEKTMLAMSQGQQNDYTHLLVQVHAMMQAQDPLKAALVSDTLKEYLMTFFRDAKKNHDPSVEHYYALLIQLFPHDTDVQALNVISDPCVTAAKPKHTQASVIYCQDTFQNFSAPELVLISQAGEPVFAMSRYEISFTEYNLFCEQSGACQPTYQNVRLPLSGVTVKQFERYAQWLTDVTGYEYTVPAVDQWQLAAHNMFTSIKHDNCQVSDKGKIIRGNKPRRVRIGADGNFGLVNLIGNIAEVVKRGDEYFIAGGDYNTEISQCTATALVVANMEGSAVTGLRLVRALKK